VSEYKAWNERLSKSANKAEISRVELDEQLPNGWDKPLNEFLDTIVKDKPD